MKYRIFYALMIVMLVMIVGFISGPAISGEPADQNLKLASSNTTFEGILVVKEGHGDIFVKSDDGHQRRLKVNSGTSITRNGKPAYYEDLQVRDRVSVSYDSKRVVVELHSKGS
jgi:hypothetical protein